MGRRGAGVKSSSFAEFGLIELLGFIGFVGLLGFVGSFGFNRLLGFLEFLGFIGLLGFVGLIELERFYRVPRSFLLQVFMARNKTAFAEFP